MYSHLEKRLQDYSNYKDFIKQVVYLENVDSTNNYALSMNPKEEGVFIIAKSQTGGRGRNDRYWHSMEGKSIAMSAIINYPKLADPPPSLISLLSANAVLDTLSSFNLQPKVKWPIDVLVNSIKIAGILCESNYEKDSKNFIIVGIGINVNLDEKDFLHEGANYAISPTSISIELRKQSSLEDIAYKLIDSFCFWMHEYKRNNPSRIIEFWEENWNDKNKEVSIIKNDKLLTGIAKSITSKGELILEVENNIELINSGEIKI